jgi:hypothetical protein
MRGAIHPLPNTPSWRGAAKENILICKRGSKNKEKRIEKITK